MNLQDIPATSGIYKITCVTTGKFYIGSSINLQKRLYEHRRTLRNGTHSNHKMQNAWNKHGEQTFISSVIELALPQFLLEREQYWLDKMKPALNIAISAQSAHMGLKHSTESIAKMSTNRRGKPAHNRGQKHTDAARAKMSVAMRGKRSWLGKNHRPESREKLRLAHTGKKASEETKRKQRIASMGKTHSAESREKMRRAALGRTMSDEARAKMSAAKMGRRRDPKEYEMKMKIYIVTDPFGNEHTVRGLNTFCQEHHLNSSHLIQVAKGKQTHHKGWKARYPEQ